MEQPFNEQDSMKLINEMISKAKKSYVTKGIASIVWGSLIFICSLLTWSEIHFGFRYKYDEWLLPLIALVPQIWFAVKEKRKKNFVSHDETTGYYIWIAFGVSLFILNFYCSKHAAINQVPLLMMLYGIPTFITGGMTRFRPMIFGGIACWVFAVIGMFVSAEINLLLMAATAIFAWLLPGIILWVRYTKQRGENV